MADPEPPKPVPIPIRIVSDPAPSSDSDDDTTPEVPTGKRSDAFYKAWDKFLAIEPKRAKSISKTARKVEEVRKAVDKSPGDGLQVQGNAATSWEQAATDCKAKVAAIVEECTRLNQKYRDASFNLETSPYCLQSLNGNVGEDIDPPPWIKRVEDVFDDPQFFIDGATAMDVHQGRSGDCWFLAALMAVTAKKELIDTLCVARDERVGVYGFVFFRDGEWIYEVIDDKLYLRVGDDDDLDIVRDWILGDGATAIRYDADRLKALLQRGGEALYFSHCKSNETWLPLIEKAYAKAHGDYYAVEGGFTSEGIEDLTGGVGVVINPEDIMDKARFWKDQLSQVNEKYLFGGGSKPCGGKGVIGSHAYAVLQAWEEGDLKLLKLRNPWGETEWEGDWSDGSKQWTAEMITKLSHTFGDDGVFWMSYKDFLKHFPSINRVRLFNKDWKVAQQWTCVNVPWTVEYLDTKFQLTITERGPVVVVLSQPDDRYFYGLKGRFLYALHFRVYKEGCDEDRWIVRSMHNSGDETVFTRSVSAEIEDLETGTYDVVFKVTAVRKQDGSPTHEESIMKYAVDKKEKLLEVGRRYDYAQTKGNLRAMEELVENQKKQAKKVKQEDVLKKGRKIGQQENERARLRKKRINDAMKEKRKAYEMARRGRAKSRHQRMEERRAAKAIEAKAEPTKAGASDGDNSDDDGNDGDSSDDDSSEPETEKVTESKGGNAADAADSDSPSTASSQLDDEEYESPLEPPEEMDDDDFDWDSGMDGPVAMSDDDSPEATNSEKDIFADDPWNALCVLGLRVYSLNSAAEVKVVKNEFD